MPKSKTFQSDADGPIVVAVPGQSPVALEPGKTVETDDPAVIAALSANPDLSVKKGKS